MLRQTLAGLWLLLAFTVVLGIGYPLLMTGIGQVALPGRADGSLVQLHGTTVGSSLIGQEFKGQGFKGQRWFQSRSSAAGYDARASGGTNLGPNSSQLREAVERARVLVAEENGVALSDVPPDAVTSSGSGLDPHISPAYADLQVARVARARGMSVFDVQQLVDDHTQGRILGFLGEPRVNVLELNLALAHAGQ